MGHYLDMTPSLQSLALVVSVEASLVSLSRYFIKFIGSKKRSFCRTPAAMLFFVENGLFSVQNTGSTKQRSIYLFLMSMSNRAGNDLPVTPQASGYGRLYRQFVEQAVYVIDTKLTQGRVAFPIRIGGITDRVPRLSTLPA
jgi:hypothetical protein